VLLEYDSTGYPLQEPPALTYPLNVLAGPVYEQSPGAWVWTVYPVERSAVYPVIPVNTPVLSNAAERHSRAEVRYYLLVVPSGQDERSPPGPGVVMEVALLIAGYEPVEIDCNPEPLAHKVPFQVRAGRQMDKPARELRGQFIE
jgi:hypothetical protein